MRVPSPPENPTVPVVSDRGFKRLPLIQSTYGGHIRMYESSAAEHPHIWVNIVEPKSLNDPDNLDHPNNATVHLSLENAEALRDQLTYMIDNHYQLQD